MKPAFWDDAFTYIAFRTRCWRRMRDFLRLVCRLYSCRKARAAAGFENWQEPVCNQNSPIEADSRIPRGRLPGNYWPEWLLCDVYIFSSVGDSSLCYHLRGWPSLGKNLETQWILNDWRTWYISLCTGAGVFTRTQTMASCLTVPLFPRAHLQ